MKCLQLIWQLELYDPWYLRIAVPHLSLRSRFPNHLVAFRVSEVLTRKKFLLKRGVSTENCLIWNNLRFKYFLSDSIFTYETGFSICVICYVWIFVICCNSCIMFYFLFYKFRFTSCGKDQPKLYFFVMFMFNDVSFYNN